MSAGLGMSVPYADFVGAVLSAPGGSVTASGSGSFSETFSALVMPNLFHTIIMEAHGTPLNSSLYNDAGYSWALGGYIDPIITIDPAFADRFSVVQSSIPIVAVPVPEASTLAMLLGGLGLLGWAAARRRRA